MQRCILHPLNAQVLHLAGQCMFDSLKLTSNFYCEWNGKLAFAKEVGKLNFHVVYEPLFRQCVLENHALASQAILKCVPSEKLRN